ncbi:HD domain-containing protein [Acinetobacter ihumii]|uniref:HD domain-containing protein n=1 Tax=Acinetobacter ihumii TaxID=2483802 RepID=UPI0010305916|nr:HD domain-containing protein [Acinetobacter ihumii]
MLGSYTWLKQTQGKINFKDKLYLLQKTLAPTTTHLLQRLGPQNTKLHVVDYHAVPLPDTLLVKDAIEQLEQTQNLSIINHSWRSYYWGVAFSQINRWQYDAEAFLVAALLHDVGLVDAHEPAQCHCFTLHSATQAEKICQKHQYSHEKIELISNAISMHMNGFSNLNQPKEVLMLQKGTSCDVIGSELQFIHADFQKYCLENYPRENFNHVFRQLIQHEVERHPYSRTAFLNTLGLTTLIRFNPFKE